MGAVSGATSLIELILKKWGDDIAGAAKELEQKVGFPESVANRIATGELPMDAESVAKRAQDQGYDLSSRWYHGTNEDFSEFDPERVGSAYGVDDQGFYFTSSEDEAMKWAENAPNASSPRVMETLLSTDNPWLIDAPDGRSPVEYFESGEGVFNRGQNAAVDYGIDSGYDGMVIRGGDEDMAIAFDPSRIRSPNAAFDPEYKGSNIMGGLALPVAGGLLAAGQSEDADASVVTPAIRRILSTVDKADADRVAKEIEGGWFLHNTDKFDAPEDPTRFGQHIEPSGQYISPTSGPRNDLPENITQGQKDFQNPLMLKSSGGYQDPGNGKHQLSEMYDGLTGQDLSDAVRADGYDGIYTLESGPRGSYLSEAVDLSQGKAGSKIERGNATVPMLATTAGLSGAGVVLDSLFEEAFRERNKERPNR